MDIQPKDIFDSKTTLCRGISLSTEQWVIGSFVWTGAGYYLVALERAKDQFTFQPLDFPDGDHTVLHEVDPSSLGRITGQMDLAGKMAFEGDIILPKTELPVGGDALGLIRYGPNRFGLDHKPTEVGFYVEWAGEGTEFWRNDLNFWLEHGVIIKNSSGQEMDEDTYKALAAVDWFPNR